MRSYVMSFNFSQGLVVPTEEYANGKVFYIWYEEKLRQARYVYSRPYIIRACSTSTEIGTYVGIEIAGIGVKEFDTIFYSIFASKADFKNGISMRACDTLRACKIDMVDILNDLDDMVFGKSEIVKKDYAVRWYRYTLVEGMAKKSPIWLPLDYKYTSKGLVITEDMFNAIANVKDSTYATAEQCLANEGNDVVCFADEVEEDEVEDENTLILTAKGEKAKRLAETLSNMLNTDVEIRFDDSNF